MIISDKAGAWLTFLTPYPYPPIRDTGGIVEVGIGTVTTQVRQHRTAVPKVFNDLESVAKVTWLPGLDIPCYFHQYRLVAERPSRNL